MSWQGTEFVRKVCGVTSTEKAVLMILAVHHHHVSGVCQVSQQQIAKESCISERHCIRVLRALESRMILRRARDGNGSGSVTRFEIVGLEFEQGDICARKGDIPDRKGDIQTGKGDISAKKGDTVSPPNKEIENQTNQTDQNHHASRVVTDWLAIKSQIELQISPDDYRLWLRPIYLLKDMRGTLLLALPPNSRIVEAARKHKDFLLRAVRARGYDDVVFTRYPDPYELEKLAGQNPEWSEVAKRLKNKKPAASERTA